VSVSDCPEWVPEKFRVHPEKFAEAYTNLEREYHQSRQECAGLRTNLSLVESENAVLHELVGRLYAEREVLGVQEALSSQAQRLLDAMETTNGRTYQ
jgi:hypothetical protein